jgi:hypothetical protein
MRLGEKGVSVRCAQSLVALTAATLVSSCAGRTPPAPARSPVENSCRSQEAPGPELSDQAVDAGKLPPDVATSRSIVAVGDGWGCAKVFLAEQPDDFRRQASWQCWRSPTSKDRRVHARPVPWLSADGPAWVPTVHVKRPALPIGPDRLCFLDGMRHRCWAWPDFTCKRPTDFPETQALARRVGREFAQLLVGGTFTCTLQPVSSERMLLCSGDDSYGQLAKQWQPPPGIRVQWATALGTWHGCTSGEEIYCWGRGDGGQLGFEPDETCQVGNRRIACSRAIRKTPFRATGNLYAGDMFTCRGGSELACWGASRDGWFGHAPCSSELRQSWPVGTGFVPAPRATCSATPVTVPGFEATYSNVSVGPRGACAVVGARVDCVGGWPGVYGGYDELMGCADGNRRFIPGKVHCVGAIPTPSVEVSRVAVSRGVQASACGVAGDQIVCWGEGYSPPGMPNQAVVIAFASSH